MTAIRVDSVVVRVSTHDDFPPEKYPPPSRRTRLWYFAGGAALGALIGYGLITASPDPPSLLSEGAIAWIGGGALVCGLLAAASPRRVWLQGRFRWRHTSND